MTIFERNEYEICTVCAWEDDPLQNADPDFKGGANIISLNEARLAYFSQDAKIFSNLV